MGRKIIVASQKGGVGKTTTSLNLAFSLSRFGDRVLVIDADPQGSLAVASNLRTKTNAGLVDVLRGNARPSDVMAETRDGSMVFVGPGVHEPEDVLFLEQEAQKGTLAKLIQALAEPFPYTVVDAPSGLGQLVRALMGAVDGVVLPVQPRALSIKTLPTFLRAVRETKRSDGTALRLEGVLLTMVDPMRPADQAMADEIKNSFPAGVFFETQIPTHDLFEEASLRAVPVALLSGGQVAARPFVDLAFELQIKMPMEGDSDGETAGLF